MDHTPHLLQRPGIYHPMYLSGPHLPGQERWLDETCAVTEAFVESLDDVLDEERRSLISFSIHLLADFLFDMFGPEAAWDRLECESFMARLEAEMKPVIPIIPMTAAQLYLFLVATGRVDRVRGSIIAETLAVQVEHMLDAASAPNRAARRRRARRNRRRMH